MNSIVFDIETDNLLLDVTKIHCIVTYNVGTQEYGYFSSTNIQDGLDLLCEADELVGHNIIGFDLPVIKKLYPSFYFKGKVLDTLIMSKIAFPDIGEMDIKKTKLKKYFIPSNLVGKYSLEAWGYRLHNLKGDYGKNNSFNKFNKELLAYCKQDVHVTKTLFDVLKKQNIPEECLNLEFEFAKIIQTQEQRGVCFDVEKANKLAVKLSHTKFDLEKKLKEVFPDEIIQEEFIAKVNSISKGLIKGQKFTRTRVVEFKPSSRQMIANRLIKKYNWKPEKYTEPTKTHENGIPIINEEVLDSLDYPEAKLFKDYLMINKILGQLTEGRNAWLKLVRDNIIYGSVDTAGTVTGRCVHFNPNLAQVPAISKDKDGNVLLGIKGGFGEESRSLFIPRNGYKLVGTDASGLELRCLAHFMRDDEYTNMLLNGDIHTHNQKAAGLPTRDMAKTFIYGLLYGAGYAKIGSIINKGAKEGRIIKDRFEAAIPSMKRLNNQVRKVIKSRGYLYGLDGRILHVRAEYRGLNVLLQSAGALIMKKALCILYGKCLQQGWKLYDDFAFVLNIHDEIQAEVKEEFVMKYQELSIQAIKEAGEYFKFRCPLDGDSKVGLSWAETH